MDLCTFKSKNLNQTEKQKDEKEWICTGQWSFGVATA